MPLFDFTCVLCDKSEERNVTISERDRLFCECGNRLIRNLTFKGAVYAPTATGGGMKR
jgi:hypothetical protein